MKTRCSNCATEYPTGAADAIEVVGHDALLVAALCPACTEGVNVLKIVVKRNAEGHFVYEQYSPLEMQEKAFGKAGNLERLG